MKRNVHKRDCAIQVRIAHLNKEGKPFQYTTLEEMEGTDDWRSDALEDYFREAMKKRAKLRTIVEDALYKCLVEEREPNNAKDNERTHSEG